VTTWREVNGTTNRPAELSRPVAGNEEGTTLPAHGLPGRYIDPSITAQQILRDDRELRRPDYVLHL